MRAGVAKPRGSQWERSDALEVAAMVERMAIVIICEDAIIKRSWLLAFLISRVSGLKALDVSFLVD